MNEIDALQKVDLDKYFNKVIKEYKKNQLE